MIKAFPALLSLAAILATSLTLSSCVTKRKIYDSSGVLVDEQTIVNRPVKRFVKSAEFE